MQGSLFPWRNTFIASKDASVSSMECEKRPQTRHKCAIFEVSSVPEAVDFLVNGW